MSDQKPDNPSAFPITRDWREGGMTLQDYFAIKILPTIMPDCASYEKAAKDSYDMAYEMLKAREAK